MYKCFSTNVKGVSYAVSSVRRVYCRCPTSPPSGAGILGKFFAAAVRTAAAIVPLGGGTYCRGMLRPSCLFQGKIIQPCFSFKLVQKIVKGKGRMARHVAGSTTKNPKCAADDFSFVLIHSSMCSIISYYLKSLIIPC